jgi:L-threonylcarbamoyladenylate synthase
MINTKNTQKHPIIQQAVDLLRAGKLVAIPTETVYGLAADANNPEAVAKIFEVKKRLTDHPIPILIANNSLLSSWAIDIPKTAYQLTKAFWPGPLTIILKRAAHVSAIITGGRNTIGLRSPNHSIAQQILASFDGLAVTSANLSGNTSPTTAEDVKKELGDSVDLIVDAGACQIGVASTIIDLTLDQPKLLRQGIITQKMIDDPIRTNL